MHLLPRIFSIYSGLIGTQPSSRLRQICALLREWGCGKQGEREETNG